MEADSHQQDELNREISSELGSFVDSRSSTFTCGGSIPIDLSPQSSIEAEADTNTDTDNNPQVETDKLSSPPITIRWDSRRSDATYKVTLPIVSSDEDGQSRFAALVSDCEPASFGYQGKDVYDENYRKATKLDSSDFSTNFCPYSLGIIDTIAQVLLPNSLSGNSRTGVRAELYKLNFYSTPSGFFKAHVDTPRSEAQFGSLVVSLPCAHEGGQLVVRHAGHSVTYDWSTSKAKAEVAQCQWAAFYSDCEHEVLELTEGHRLTLTYNLYVVPGVGQLAGNSPALDVYSLPLFQKVKEALASPVFMPQGGWIGIYCIHAYPHNTRAGRKSLPGILKGADMAVYAVFRSLGLKVLVKTVLDEDKVNKMTDRDEPYDAPLTRVGDWGTVVTTEAGGHEEATWLDIFRDFSRSKVQINWLTKRQKENRNTGFVHLTYGNQVGMHSIYTYAILLVKISPASERIPENNE
ncbi:hypothetical protein F4805DRAFT_81424 [Annulohypoxylon moriforme]|nr:hypothetical protein F4805DRAFT_81424 [Annulohypoxylon moriforme]